MTRLILLLAVSVLFTAASKGTSLKSKTGTAFYIYQDVKKFPVKPADLPPGIKEFLSGENYRGKPVRAAYYVKGENAGYYQIELRDSGKISVIKLTKAGELLP